MSGVVCEYCFIEIKSKYNLKAHLTNNKNCLKIRGVNLGTTFICKGCDYIFTNNKNLGVHKETCKKYIIFKLKEEFDTRLKDTLEKYKEENNINCEQQKVNYEQQIHDQKVNYEQQIHDQKVNYEQQIHDQKVNYDKQQSLFTEEYKEKIRNLELTNRDMNHKITQHELKIIDMKHNYEKIIKDIQSQNDKLLENLQKLASQAIDRPTTATTNVTNNTIKNNFSTTYFLETIKPEDVKMKCQNYLTEQVFLEGQRGIAQLCTDHVIKTKDKKMLMICTDVSRKKFKYMDEEGNIKEDYDARTFTNKISKPIKDASRIVYDSILFDVKNEKEMLEEDDYSRKAYLNSKELKTIDCFVQISHFDDPDNNQEFKNELAILNKNL
jgi:hypothetical protein